MTEEQFRKLKQEVEEATAAAERAQGAHGQLLQQLQEEFDCQDIKGAKKLLAALTEKRDRAEKAFQKAVSGYEKTWKSNQNIKL